MTDHTPREAYDPEVSALLRAEYKTWDCNICGTREWDQIKEAEAESHRIAMSITRRLAAQPDSRQGADPMTATDIEAKNNAMYALYNRIESALLATYGPIEKWDEDYGIGLSSGQYKSLAATMAEWFMDWIKDEGMVRTPRGIAIIAGEPEFKDDDSDTLMDHLQAMSYNHKDVETLFEIPELLEVRAELTARLRTPGTVEISREAATHIGHFMRDASHFDPEFDQWVLVEIDAALAQEDTNDTVQ